MSVFKKSKKSHLKKTIFLDEPVDIARYDTVKYPQFSVLLDKQLGFFWRPQKISLSKDSKDFADLPEYEKHIFTSNLKRQTLLDSVQGRAPVEVFTPIVSIPEMEIWVQAWTFMETIHSLSYTHIIRNVYANPSTIFDELLDIPEILDCAKDISKYYNELKKHNWTLEGVTEDYIPVDSYDEYEHKKAIWMAVNAVNALEGIRFYASFACSWAFAERGLMEGNAKIIKEICRDENLHLASTQAMLKLLPKDDKTFAKIAKECENDVLQMFDDVVEQEKLWAEYLFKDGSMLGLNEDTLKAFVEFIANKRLKAIGYESRYETKKDPLPWTKEWIAGHNVQVAPQETEKESYLIGEIDNDMDENSLKGFKL